MATSGSLNTSAYKFTNGSRYLTLNWSVAAQSISANETTISWELVGAGDYTSAPVCSDFHVEIDGAVVYDKPSTYHVNVYKGTVIASGTKTIKHNVDGSKSFTAFVEAGIYVHNANVSGTGTWELPTIPQASELAVYDGTLGTAQNLTVTRKSTNYTHTITYACGSASGTICTKSASESISFTPPLGLASQNTVGTTVSVTFTIQTYSGDTAIGSAVTKTVTMAIPASVKPSVSLAVSDDNGHATTYGAYIKTLSKLKIVATPTLAYGSQIASYNITADGNTYNEASIVTDVLKSSGTLKITATVTDKRGRIGTATASITVLDYVAPSISNISASRCNADGTPNEQGSNFKVTFSASITPLNNKNTATYVLEYKKANESDFCEPIPFPVNGDYSVTEAESAYIFAADSAPYDISVTAMDSHNTLTRSTFGAAALYLIVPHESGNGLGLGMIPTHEGGLDLGFDIYMFDKKIFGMFPVGAVYLEGNNENPSTKFGGSWSLVNSTAIPGVYFWKRTS